MLRTILVLIKSLCERNANPFSSELTQINDKAGQHKKINTNIRVLQKTYLNRHYSREVHGTIT